MKPVSHRILGLATACAVLLGAGIILAAAGPAGSGPAFAQDSVDGAVQGLRGAPIDGPDPQPELYSTMHSATFGRAYRQQPPLIPHTIDKYEIDLKVNQCLGCHAWPYTQDSGAPKLSETHFTDRDGNPTDEVAARRWFCNQCHVPQANAPALVDNTFRNAAGR